jgi:phosphoglycolate phosphatase
VPAPSGLMVFDLDGTLVDSSRDLANSGNDLLRAYGGAPLDDATVVGMVGDGARELVRRLLAAADLQAPVDEALERFMALYGGRLVETTRPYDGVVDVLERLHDEVALALLTNKPAGLTARLMEELDLARFFPHVIAGDQPVPRKPDPAGLRSLMGVAGVAPELTVMVGDSANDALTAAAAGTACCLVRYGFGFARLDDATRAGATWIIDRPRQLLAVVPGAGR